MAALTRIAASHNLARLTRHGELISQLRAPTLRIGAATVTLPPAAFLQSTAEGEAVLARLVLAACADAKYVADLFCGIGPFALRLAAHARVLAIDDDEAAVAALKRAAATATGLKPIETATRDLFKDPLAAGELKKLDAVVFDPPRQGAFTQARALAASRVPLIVAVSCNAGTFARDAAELVRGGYRLVEVTPVDQFRYSEHVEIVGRIRALKFQGESLYAAARTCDGMASGLLALARNSMVMKTISLSPRFSRSCTLYSPFP